MIDIDDLLMQIEEEVASGKKTIFGGNVQVNGDKILAIVASIRENLPDALRDAKQLINNSEKRRIDDYNRAQNIIMQAERRAGDLLSEHTIIEAAEMRAAEIMQQVREEQARIISNTRRSLYEIIHAAEQRIVDALHDISSLKEEV